MQCFRTCILHWRWRGNMSWIQHIQWYSSISKCRSNGSMWHSLICDGRQQEDRLCRCMSTKQQVPTVNIFDRKMKRMQRDRSAISLDEDVTVYDYIKDEFGYRLSDRICDIKRKFPVAVDLGCGRGHVSKHIYCDMVEKLFQCDLSPLLLKQAQTSSEVPTSRVVVDEEFLPFRDNSLDMVVSNLSLHWVNDLPGCFKQILQALKNDGVFLGSMFGGDTLYELRVSLQLAELEREGGFAAHVSPFTTVNDLGNLMTGAGFTMLTLDIDEITINYPSMFELMYDLKGMAESNCSWSRKPQLHRDTMLAAAAVYKEMYGNDQGIPGTFQVINFIGWKPDPNQRKAAERGSGQVSLKDISMIDQLTKKMKDSENGKESSVTGDTQGDGNTLDKELHNVSRHYVDPDMENGRDGKY